MRNKIILNMIVKNEAHIINRCLTSVLPLIDGWVICDTGSTDGTQTVIKETLSKIPGKLIERPWVHFEQNRNEALESAKEIGDYLLFMDADDYLEISPSFRRFPLEVDGYLIGQKTKELEARAFQYLLAVKSSLPWRWVGRLHEELICSKATRFATIEGITHICTLDGARSRDPNKLLNDLEVLLRAHQEEPENSRYVQFLGLTNEAIGRYDSALRFFEKRVNMGGWDEECFYAQYRVAEMQKKLEYAFETVSQSYLQAHAMRPWRSEPLFWLAEFSRSQGDLLKAHSFAKTAALIPYPYQDSIAIESWIYEYGANKLLESFKKTPSHFQ